MEEQATGEAEVKVAEAQDKVAEAEQEQTITPDQAKELQAKLTKMETDLESARGEAKAHQRAVFTKENELKQAKAFESRVEKIETQSGIMTQMLADIMDSKDSEVYGEETKPKTRPSERYLKTLEDQDQLSQKATKEKEDQEKADQEWSTLVTEAQGLLKSINVEPDKFEEAAKEKPELLDAYIKFISGNAKSGLDELRKAVSKMAEKKTETPEEMKARITKEILIEKGELDSDTGQPAGAGTSDANFKKGIGDGSLPLTKSNMERAKSLGLAK